MATVGDSDPAITAGRFRLRIVAANMGGERWKSQLDLIRDSGASYAPDDKEWFLWLDACPLRTGVLNALFTVAAEYGTHVSVDKVVEDAGGTAS